MFKITKYKVKGPLPNPFIFDNGKPVETLSDWELRYKEIYDYSINLQFGGMPPKPEFLEVEHLNKGKNHSTYKIYTGTKDNPVSFIFKFISPKVKNRPIIIDGDMCAEYFMKEAFIKNAIDNQIGWVLFDRTEIASDLANNKKKGAIFRTYPNHKFGVLSAWAWGYMRCIDALYKLNLEEVDLNCISITGHSRGGKATLIAGAIDKRIAIVNPNEACLCGGGCYRIQIEAKYNDLDLWRSETLKDIWENSSSWIGEQMEKYIDKENLLPFDTHFIKSMVAPRVLLISEAIGDIWSNPVGAWMTTIASKEVFKFLNSEKNLYWYFREGIHYHKAEDIKKLVEIILYVKDGKQIAEEFYNVPFEKPELIYKWSNVNRKGEN